MPLPRIRVSANRRFLMTEHGEPFFWLGDTAWELFHRLSLPEAEHYLDVRRQQGFNLIQAVRWLNSMVCTHPMPMGTSLWLATTRLAPTSFISGTWTPSSAWLPKRDSISVSYPRGAIRCTHVCGGAVMLNLHHSFPVAA